MVSKVGWRWVGRSIFSHRGWVRENSRCTLTGLDSSKRQQIRTICIRAEAGRAEKQAHPNLHPTSQSIGASNLSLPLSLSKPHIMKFHLISLIFLFLTVHRVFSGHLFLLTSCRSLALTLLSVLAPSAQLHQRFRIPFRTLSVHPIHLTLSGATWKHTISKLLLIRPSRKPQRLWFTCD